MQLYQIKNRIRNVRRTLRAVEDELHEFEKRPFQACRRNSLRAKARYLRAQLERLYEKQKEVMG